MPETPELAGAGTARNLGHAADGVLVQIRPVGADGDGRAFRGEAVAPRQRLERFARRSGGPCGVPCALHERQRTRDIRDGRAGLLASALRGSARSARFRRSARAHFSANLSY